MSAPKISQQKSTGCVLADFLQLHATRLTDQLAQPSQKKCMIPQYNFKILLK